MAVAAAAVGLIKKSYFNGYLSTSISNQLNQIFSSFLLFFSHSIWLHCGEEVPILVYSLHNVRARARAREIGLSIEELDFTSFSALLVILWNSFGFVCDFFPFSMRIFGCKSMQEKISPHFNVSIQHKIPM